jgi:hypothetical protein
MHNEELYSLYSSTYYYDDQIKEEEMGGSCIAHEGDEKCVQNFGWNAWKEETIRKTLE